MTITVLYSCHGCGLSKVTCEVPARTTEEIVNWVQNVMGPALRVDHDSRSPNCTSNLADVMIPISGADKIGGPAIQ